MSNRLARILDERMRQHAAVPDSNELGTIQDDMSLLLDHFAVPIPTDGYRRGRNLRLVRDPDPALAPGDRVIVCWVNGMSDPIVVDVVEAP